MHVIYQANHTYATDLNSAMTYTTLIRQLLCHIEVEIMSKKRKKKTGTITKAWDAKTKKNSHSKSTTALSQYFAYAYKKRHECQREFIYILSYSYEQYAAFASMRVTKSRYFTYDSAGLTNILRIGLSFLFCCLELWNEFFFSCLPFKWIPRILFKGKYILFFHRWKVEKNAFGECAQMNSIQLDHWWKNCVHDLD